MTHGTQMASFAMKINPSQKLVLIRLVAFNARGERLPDYESTVLQAFKWISSKRKGLNIGTVAMAQGYHPSLSGENYCPKVKSQTIQFTTVTWLISMCRGALLHFYPGVNQPLQ